MVKVKNLEWLKEDQREFLKDGYLAKGETPEQRYSTICNTIETYCLKMSKDTESVKYSHGIAERFKGYVEKGWVSFATPVLSNFGAEHNLPISCNKSILSDSLDSIMMGQHEIATLAKYGAGTSENFSNIRPIGSDISTGGTSNSVIDWVEMYAHLISKVSQNRNRRGFLTAYLSVDHPEIMEFLKIGTHRLPAEKQRFLQNITTGVTLPKGWLKNMKEGDSQKREIWGEILRCRKEIGYPYIVDLENANDQKPQWYKDKNMDIITSNICCETMEYCDEEKTFACCLSSVNLYHYDEWKDHPDFIFDMTLMLDCVIEEYIEKASSIQGFEKAVKFAKEHRSVGLGVLAFHSYLQKKGVVFGSFRSMALNNEIFSLLNKETKRASEWMAKHWGEPKILKGYGRRNTTLIAQAPWIVGEL